jgi:hypothetical protein
MKKKKVSENTAIIVTQYPKFESGAVVLLLDVNLSDARQPWNCVHPWYWALSCIVNVKTS